jgi:hypothetical protein
MGVAIKESDFFLLIFKAATEALAEYKLANFTLRSDSKRLGPHNTTTIALIMLDYHRILLLNALRGLGLPRN